MAQTSDEPASHELRAATLNRRWILYRQRPQAICDSSEVNLSAVEPTGRITDAGGVPAQAGSAQSSVIVAPERRGLRFALPVPSMDRSLEPPVFSATPCPLLQHRAGRRAQTCSLTWT
jgi:hypothetical protein